MFTKILEGIEHMMMFSDEAKYDSWKKEALEAIGYASQFSYENYLKSVEQILFKIPSL